MVRMALLEFLLLLFVLFVIPASAAVVPAVREVFSVAPMMGHTNRHHHTYFRQFSKFAHLYTEMIPATQILHLAKNDLKKLNDILRINDEESHPVALQLGGNNPEALAKAARIGASFGYNGVNLNAGCPSNAVSGRCGGASLMKQPLHVADIVTKMSDALQQSYPKVQLSVKHRLGVAQIVEYDATWDRKQDDTRAYESCLKFVETIAATGCVSKFQVHGRLALLGDFQFESDSSNNQGASLWLPEPADSKTGEIEHRKVKVNHSRLQYQAKRRARMATIQNRSIPPLRPGVVRMLAERYPDLEFVSNGGIDTMEDLKRTVTKGVAGGMCGRSVINHPCCFSLVDTLWGIKEDDLQVPNRREVLESFILYCSREEKEHKSETNLNTSTEELRRRLVAVPFTLFAGEDGSDAYQRRIRKLISRPDRHTSHGILTAAMAEVPAGILQKRISEYSYDIPSFDKYRQRSGPLQRSIL